MLSLVAYRQFTLLITTIHFFIGFFTNYNDIVDNLVSSPSTCLCSTIVDGILSKLDTNSLYFLTILASPTQKLKCYIQYEPGIAFYIILQGTFVLNDNLWATPYFLIDFTFLITTIIYPIPNSLTSLTLLRSSLYLRLLLETNILNSSMCINRSGDMASKQYKASL